MNTVNTEYLCNNLQIFMYVLNKKSYNFNLINLMTRNFQLYI